MNASRVGTTLALLLVGVAAMPACNRRPVFESVAVVNRGAGGNVIALTFRARPGLEVWVTEPRVFDGTIRGVADQAGRLQLDVPNLESQGGVAKVHLHANVSETKLMRWAFDVPLEPRVLVDGMVARCIGKPCEGLLLKTTIDMAHAAEADLFVDGRRARKRVHGDSATYDFAPRDPDPTLFTALTYRELSNPRLSAVLKYPDADLPFALTPLLLYHQSLGELFEALAAGRATPPSWMSSQKARAILVLRSPFSGPEPGIRVVEPPSPWLLELVGPEDAKLAEIFYVARWTRPTEMLDCGTYVGPSGSRTRVRFPIVSDVVEVRDRTGHLHAQTRIAPKRECPENTVGKEHLERQRGNVRLESAPDLVTAWLEQTLKRLP